MLKQYRVSYRIITIAFNTMFLGALIVLIIHIPRLLTLNMEWERLAFTLMILAGVAGIVFIPFIIEQHVLEVVFCVSTRDIKIFINKLEKNKESLSDTEKEILRLANSSKSQTFKLYKKELSNNRYRVEIRSDKDSVIIQKGDEKRYLEWLKYSKYFEIV